MDRRRLIRAAFFASLAPSLVGCGVVNRGVPRFEENPFSLGVGAGDPVADGFVLWTRVAPDPFGVRQPAREDIPVNWEIAEDYGFSTIIRAGQVLAHHEHGHSIHVHVAGLEHGREYFYRFHCAGATSPVGRALTCPDMGGGLDSLRLALCCCQSYTDGFYAAYRDVADQVPDLVVHVGDYIYERPLYTGVRAMPTPEAVSLDDYRKYHAVTKTDPHLQAAHAIAPWLAIWDDHEVVDDYRALHAPAGHTSASFRSRRAAAYKAYYEHMPLRLPDGSGGAQMQLYRRVGFGNLAQFDLLDTRQYRSDHPCRTPDGLEPPWISCDVADPNRSLLGGAQESWFARGFGAWQTKWNFVVQTTQVTPYERLVSGGLKFSSDRWDAYPASRERLVEVIRDKASGNTVVLGGDIHAFLLTTLTDESGNAIASELITGAISSGGGGEERYEEETRYHRARNIPFYYENRTNGYLALELQPQTLTVKVRSLESVLEPDSQLETIQVWEVDRSRNQ